MESVYKYRRTGRVGASAFRGIVASGGMVNKYAFAGARGGAYSGWRRGRYYSRPGYARSGYTRRAGFYGRFGTGRGRRAQIEKKFFDASWIFAADSTVEPIDSIVKIPQGATQSTRVGYKCVVKSLQYRGLAQLPAGATSNDDVYMYIIQDTQANGANPISSDIWTTSTAAVMLRNIQNGDRFKILVKEKIQLNANAGVAAAFDGDQKVFEGFLKVNIPMSYNGATGAVTEMKSNNIMCWVGSVSTDDVMEFNCSYRVRYTDQ